MFERCLWQGRRGRGRAHRRTLMKRIGVEVPTLLVARKSPHPLTQKTLNVQIHTTTQRLYREQRLQGQHRQPRAHRHVCTASCTFVFSLSLSALFDIILSLTLSLHALLFLTPCPHHSTCPSPFLHAHNTGRSLKSQGKYASRSLSFVDTEFKMVEIQASEEFTMLYDASAELWYVRAMSRALIRTTLSLSSLLFK